MQGVQAISEVLGGQACLGGQVDSFSEMDRLIRQGLPYDCARGLQEAMSLTEASLAALLALSPRTLHRLRQEGKRLPLAASDRLYRLARVVSLATEVLEDRQAALAWLSEPRLALGGRKPWDLLLTEAGCRQVEELLGRIEYGVLA